MAELGQLIQEHRRRRGWTQTELARTLGISQTMISQWENERETWNRRYYFDELLKVFDYPEDLLIWWIDDELTVIEQKIEKARDYKNSAMGQHRPRSVLEKLDELITQNRVMHGKLIELRQQLQERPQEGSEPTAA